MLVTNFFPDFGFFGSSQGLSSRTSNFYDLAKISEIECDGFATHLPSLAFNDGVCSFSLSESETQAVDDSLESYGNAFDGYISGEGMRWRVLYLSTGTVTTLGYGDIVPITDVTRSVVAFQSILDLVFMGLFINSVAGSRHDAVAKSTKR